MAKARKLPSGRWRVNLYLGRDQAGKQLYKSITANTKREAEYQAAMYALHAKGAKSTADMTVGAAIDNYIANRTAILSPSTIGGYEKIRRTALQAIMRTKLTKLTQEAVTRAVNQDAAHLSPKTVSNAHGLLTAALREYAPTIHLTTRLPARQKPDLTIPDNAMVRVILDKAKDKDKELYCAAILAAQMGLRRSEICALQAADVSESAIRINKALVIGPGGKLVTKAPKSYAGARTLEAPPGVLEAIAALGVTDGPLIRCTPTALTCRWQRLNAPCRFHDLRHYYASVMLALGVPDKYAQERMGHSTTNMLHRVYQHTMNDTRERVAHEINSFFADTKADTGIQKTRKFGEK